MVTSNPYESGTIQVAKNTTLTPFKPQAPTDLSKNLKGTIGTKTLSTDLIAQIVQEKYGEKKTAEPEPDERLKAFFRVKIGGLSQAPDPTKPGPAPAEPVDPAKPTPATGKESTKPTPGKETATKTKETEDGKVKQTTEDKSQKPTPTTNPLAPEMLKAAKFDTSISLKPGDFKKGLPALDLSKVGTGGKLDVETVKQMSQVPVQANSEPSAPREMVFDSARGDFLDAPYVRLSTYQHAIAYFVINDPDDSVRLLIAQHTDVEIEMGFINGMKLNKFVGKIYKLGRKPPDGTIVEAVDPSYQLQETQSAGVSTTSVDPAPATAEAPAASNESVTGTFEGEASFYGGGDGFDGKKTANGEKFDSKQLTAAHRTLPFNTRVRVTNATTGKSVIVRINDRGPYAKGRVLDLSKAAAEAIGMVASGHAKVKAEVLAGNGNQAKDKSSQPATAPATKEKTPLSPTTASPKAVAPDAKAKTSTEAKAATPTDPKAATPADAKGDILGEIKQAPASGRKASLAELFVKSTDLKFNDKSPVKIQKAGDALLQQSALAAAGLEAAMKGDVLVTRGNTLSQIAPGQGESSGVVLDYKGNGAAFIRLEVVKRSALQLQSAFGSVTVQSWNPNEKAMVGATVATPAPVVQHPTGVIQAPEWGSVKLKDPIIPGSPYTWGDATRNGSRVPKNKEMMANIIRVCEVITQLTKETGQTKWTVCSWHRDFVVKATKSMHLVGGAVDFHFSGPEYQKLFQRMWGGGPGGSGGWPGGFAKGNGFLHIDVRHMVNRGGRQRWFY